MGLHDGSLLIAGQSLHRTKEPDPVGEHALHDVGGFTGVGVEDNLVSCGHINHDHKQLAPQVENVKFYLITKMRSQMNLGSWLRWQA